MKKAVLVLIIILGLFSSAAAENISRLVLYHDTAFITVEKEAINGVITIEAPAELVQDSIIAQPSSAGGTVKSIEVKPGSALSGKARDVQEQIDKLKTQISIKKRQQETIEEQIEIIYELARDTKKEVDFPRARLNESLAYIDSRVGALNERHIKLGNERDELKLRLKELEALLQNVSRQQGFKIEMQASGRTAVSYAVRNSGFKTEYIVQAWPAKDILQLENHARVWQSTGTDWTVQEMLIATGSPSYGIQAPELSRWLLSPFRPQTRKIKAEALSAMPSTEMNDSSADEYARDVKETETSYIMGAAKNIIIPGDGSPRVVSLYKHRIASEMSRVSVPKLSKSAFLRAEATWQGEVPLLAGDYTAFIDGEYCGKGFLKSIQPQERMSIDLGKDEGVKIDRKVTPFNEKTLTGKSRSIRNVMITVENAREKRIVLKVKDQIPVSDDESIKVELTDTLPAAKPDEDGILTWDIALEPKSKIILRFGYSVTGSFVSLLD